MSRVAEDPEGRGPGTLTIGELAARTGLAPAVLRTWESRHGFPAPGRSSGGQRVYSEADVDLVHRVLRRQGAGVRLDAAIREVLESTQPAWLSIFAMLRDHHPRLTPVPLHKPTLLALSRAVEDEYLASAEAGVLCASFQQERFYLASSARWAELARRSRWSMVFADFATLHEQGLRGPARVPLLDDAPMRREWAVVAETQRFAVCLAGWEPPGQDDVPDASRTFEAVWTVDPQIARHALKVCAEVAGKAGLSSASNLRRHLDDHPLGPGQSPERTSALFNRAIGYVDRDYFATS